MATAVWLMFLISLGQPLEPANQYHLKLGTVKCIARITHVSHLVLIHSDLTSYSMANFFRLLALTLGLIFLTATVSPSNALAQRVMLVSSLDTDSFKQYDLATGAYMGDFIPAIPNLEEPQEILLAQDGKSFLASFFRGSLTTTVRQYSTDGTFLGHFSSGYTLGFPTKMTFGPDGDLYVSQWLGSQNEVVRFDGTTGVFKDVVAREGTVINQNPMGQAWLPDGTLLVTNWAQGGINGAAVGSVRSYAPASSAPTGTFASSLRGPVNLFWDPITGDLLVLDWSAGSVLRYDAVSGALKGTFISGMTRVEGYAIDGDTLYLGEWGGNAVRKYNLGTGAYLGYFVPPGGGGLIRPNSLLIYDPAGSTASEDNPDIGIPSTTQLLQNYPNPFNPQTTIAYTLATSGPVSLVVYDLFGRETVRLVDRTQEAGTHNFTFDASGLPSGVYMARLETRDVSRTRVMTVLK
jgi:hypothetical protein